MLDCFKSDEEFAAAGVGESSAHGVDEPAAERAGLKRGRMRA